MQTDRGIESDRVRQSQTESWGRGTEREIETSRERERRIES